MKEFLRQLCSQLRQDEEQRRHLAAENRTLYRQLATAPQQQQLRPSGGQQQLQQTGRSNKAPAARVETSMQEAELAIGHLYDGLTDCVWLRPVKRGDFITLHLSKPARIRRSVPSQLEKKNKIVAPS